MLVLDKIKQGGLASLLPLHIKVNPHQDGRIILNYDQLNSPKEDEIVRECRALTVDIQGNLIARSFSRFYNLGEALNITKDFKFEQTKAWTKLDGSLIKFFTYQGNWVVQTRNSFATDYINGSNYTWEQLVRQSLPRRWNVYEADFSHLTFIFELCSPYNIVVQRHTDTSIWLLTIFDGKKELADEEVDNIANTVGFLRPYCTRFDSVEEIRQYIKQQAAQNETFEGVVLKDVNGMRLKVKSEKYVALHKMFSNGNILLDKNIIPLILEGELDEAAVYFPILKERAEILKTQIKLRMDEVDNYWFTFHDVDSKKKFALSVKECKWSALLFMAYDKGGIPTDYLTADFIIKNL